MLRNCYRAMGLAAVTLLAGCSSSPPISLSLNPSTAQGTDQGVPLGFTVKLTNDVSLKGVKWSLSGAGSLTGSTGETVSYYPPTGLLTSPAMATLTVASVADPTQNASVQITANADPNLQFQTIADGTVGVPYSQLVVLNGGTAPFVWSVYDGPIETGPGVGGAVPDGLTLNVATGVVSGTPTGAGTWNFEVMLTDKDKKSTEIPVSIEIHPAGPSVGSAVPLLNQPLVPASVAPGGGAVTLKVSGVGFVTGATVDLNGVALVTTFVDREHLSAVVPTADVATARTAAVTVVNPAPGGGASNVVFWPVGGAETAVSFVNAPNSPLQLRESLGLAVADFNEDGRPDLAASGSIYVDVLLSNGDGTFTFTAGSPIPMPSPPYDDFASPDAWSMAAGDFNRSGHQGLAVGEPGNDAAVILLGNGTGALTPSTATFANTEGDSTNTVVAADFNADGNLDLAFANLSSAPVALGYGNGAFNAGGELLAPLAFPTGVAMGDFNGDGKLDAAVASGGTTTYPYSGVTVALGNGDGTFAPASGSPMAIGQSLAAIVAADFNGDGKLDLAVADETGNALLVLLGNGDGTFQAPVSLAVGKEPDAMVVGDFNNDGKLDLAIANYGDGTVTLLLGKGDGTFVQAAGSPYVVGTAPSAIVAADFNGDGKLDLAVANSLSGTGTVSVLLQK